MALVDVGLCATGDGRGTGDAADAGGRCGARLRVGRFPTADLATADDGAGLREAGRNGGRPREIRGWDVLSPASHFTVRDDGAAGARIERAREGGRAGDAGHRDRAWGID